jgi:hypothetical protein
VELTENPTPEPTKDPTLSPVTSAPTPCKSRKFYLQSTEYPNPNHLGGVVNNKCTNDGYDDDDVDKDSYDSADDCCSANFADIEECKIVDICNPTSEPTVDPTPAPVTSEPTKDPTLSPVTSAPTPCESRIIFIVTINEETICSNGYHESVDSGDYFNNFDYCCAMLVAVGKVDDIDKCKREDICNPTKAPTPAPVSPEPTENPTMKHNEQLVPYL